MNIIRILPENVASQIAAGEVVDRPASVVRELIDNSIDAGADRIVINIENGGKNLIKITDNGSGMSRDDLLLCVERHATSKIRTALDLYSINSLGFRGEAIPSIASVSKMQITTRLKEDISGQKMKIAGGKLLSIEETGAPQGTIVEVRNLFYNIPARRKFLRTVVTETTYITDVIMRIALSRPLMNLRFDDTGRNILNLSATDQPRSRLSVLFGRKVAESMIETTDDRNGIKIKAYLANSEMGRSRNDRFFVYVNKRHIRDKLVTKAILEGYGQRLMKGQYPQAVVFIDIDPSEIDVNVHPTKQEVLFNDGKAVFRAIVDVVQKTLSGSSSPYRSQRFEVKEFLRPEESPAFSVNEIKSNYPWKAEDETVFRDVSDVISKENVSEQETIKDKPKLIGQLGNTYILFENEEGLLLMDQHAAHERIVYETLKSDFARSSIVSQIMLIPYELEFSVDERNIALRQIEKFLKLGIQLDHFGGNTFLLRAVPAVLANTQWDSFLSELMPLMEDGEIENNLILDKIINVMACHGAIRASHRMADEEMISLFEQLEKMDIPTNCPHGRPVFQKLSYHEIEKMFKRVI